MATVHFEPITVEAFEPQSLLENLQKKRVRSTLWLTLIFWASLWVTLTLAAALAQNPRVIQIALMRLAATFVGLFFCYLIHLLLRKPFLSTTRKRLIALAIVAPIFAEIFAWTSFFALAAVDPTVSLKNFTWSGAVNTISFFTWFFLAWAGLYLALSYSFDVQEEQRQIAELRERTHIAQLRALHSQINPHFLFNSLNSIAQLIHVDPAKAEACVERLAEIFRYLLNRAEQEFVPLSEELQMTNAYLEIERARFDERLRVETLVDPGALRQLIPNLVLQPLVENAVKHGLSRKVGPGTLRIAARLDDGMLTLVVGDDGLGMSSAVLADVFERGVGLRNLRARLERLYGPAHLPEITSTPGGGTRVELKLPTTDRRPEAA